MVGCVLYVFNAPLTYSNENGGLRGGEKIHANVNAAKRELRYALFSSQNQKFLIASFLKGLGVYFDCSVRTQSVFESSWKPKL